MTTFFGATAVLALALGLAFALAPSDGFETEIFIAAPPETVWALLTDPVEHQGWSPNIHHVEGHFVEGDRVGLTMGTPSGGRITFHPEILVADPGRQLRWLGRLGLPGIFDGEHYFLLSAENGGTLLIQGERFHGVLLWVMDVHQFREAFESANAGLKARAETVAGQRMQGAG
ncbi:SRPBCC domain-containing protein [Tabrizicola sp. YIM 78059]|uniref:SRPBCC domain-containing protein n=1 Tax=Tabrizicola sp. YIM 78059 TaxID=2529861 RepID=UPI0010AAF407|nr:SRPBCC domain-containing protein [Tabrizicola sp. YIM 78059]